MADMERVTPGVRRRPRRPNDHAPGTGGLRHGGRPVNRTDDRTGEVGRSDDRAAHRTAEAPTPDAAERVERGGPPKPTALFVARRAAAQVAALSGRRPESVVSVERADGGWRIGVEVVEVSRIPDSADILAVYEVRLDALGTLLSYRRVRRYARGQVDREGSR